MDEPRKRRFSLFGYEQERAAVVFILAVLLLIGIAGLAFDLAGNVAGLVIIIAFVGLFLTVGFRQDVRGRVEVLSSSDDVRRILVFAHEGLGGARLVELLELREPDRGATIHIVVPALTTPLKRLAGDVDSDISGAEDDLQRLLGELEGDERRTVTGEIGDSDSRLALEDVLKTFAADEVVIINPPEGEMGRLERSATERVFDDVPLPVRELHS